MYNQAYEDGSASSVFGILAFRAFAKIPIQPLLKDLTMPVHGFYGQNDWMGREHLDKVLNEGRMVAGSSCNTVHNAGH